jgi:hypothetical protein
MRSRNRTFVVMGWEQQTFFVTDGKKKKKKNTLNDGL